MDDTKNYGIVHHPSVEFITRGAYAYYLQHYFKYFPRENILILNSSDLKENPWGTLKTVQNFFEIPIAVDEKNFVLDPATGHYCIIGKCLEYYYI